jgi:hypothetical protein
VVILYIRLTPRVTTLVCHRISLSWIEKKISRRKRKHGTYKVVRPLYIAPNVDLMQTTIVLERVECMSLLITIYGAENRHRGVRIGRPSPSPNSPVFPVRKAIVFLFSFLPAPQRLRRPNFHESCHSHTPEGVTVWQLLCMFIHLFVSPPISNRHAGEVMARSSISRARLPNAHF